MMEEQAVALAEMRRAELDIDPEMEVVSAEKAIVLANRGEEGSHPGDDRVAWIVTMSCPWGQVRVDVDDATGSILAVERTA
jgi:hypothetical protein